MRKTVSRVLSIALAVGLCGSAFASPAAGGFDANSKKTHNAFAKNRKQQQKKFSKDSKKQQKAMKKQHEA